MSLEDERMNQVPAKKKHNATNLEIQRLTMTVNTFETSPFTPSFAATAKEPSSNIANTTHPTIHKIFDRLSHRLNKSSIEDDSGYVPAK